MSASVRQSNLFAGEDFINIYKSFKDIDFTAYDYDTIKNALIEYIRIQYPEDFNDYVESSEFIAIIELLAYLGTSLAFRVDLNSRENVLDTAQRRDSIIRLARTINYSPSRNLAANGLFKVSLLQTNEPLTDSAGLSLQNVPVEWADPNNPDWFDQFVTVLNASLNKTNPFGRPSKSGTVSNIPTDLYQLNNVTGLEVAYPLNIITSNGTVPVDIVNPDFDLSFKERHPDQSQPFNFIYRNDGLGVSSNNTGFFLYFRQGRLEFQDDQLNFPIPNRVVEIDAINVNNTDVYVQEVTTSGTVVEQWTQVPATVGSNVIYNSINFTERNIYEVISGLDDSITIKYTDGNFGEVPTGIMRTWYRKSANQNLVIRPDDARGITVSIPYVGVDGQNYNLAVTFDLLETVSNGAPTETDDDIKLRAPQTYYTQDRMINNEDYSIYPLLYGNEIEKVKATNRTYAGHSRYISLNDPTGYHNNLDILGNDASFYMDDEPQRDEILLSNSVVGSFNDVIIRSMNTLLTSVESTNFYYGPYLDQQDGNEFITTSNLWKTAPDQYQGVDGYLILQSEQDYAGPADTWPEGVYDSLTNTYSNAISLNTGAFGFIKPGAVIKTVIDGEVKYTSVHAVENDGQPYNPDLTEKGTVTLGSRIRDMATIVEVKPPYRTLFNEDEVLAIETKLNQNTLFGVGYDTIADEWYVIDENEINAAGSFDYSTRGNSGNGDSSWVIKAIYHAGSTETDPTYEIVTRGTVNVFESAKQVRFYWDPDQKVYDAQTGKSLQDQIIFLANVTNDANGVPLEHNVHFNISDVFIQEDGFLESSKVEIKPVDLNEDGIPDNPDSFRILVSGAESSTDYTDNLHNTTVMFEQYVDIDGYERTRAWTTGWVDLNETTPTVDVLAKTIGGQSIFSGDLFLIKDTDDLDLILSQFNTALTTDAATAELAKTMIESLYDKSFRLSFDTNGTPLPIGSADRFFVIQNEFDPLNAIAKVKAVKKVDEQHFEKNGITSTQNTNAEQQQISELNFKWKHYAPTDQRIDPSVSNIIDMVVLTRTYYRDVLIWKDQEGTSASMPQAPTTEALRVQFSELDKYKSVSDQIVYNSCKFKLLFGPQAEPELRATLKAVKIPNASISDNELKVKIIQAVDSYFDVNNWDFGDKFYYTELAAFIHTQLSKYLSTIVIVPEKEESQFGNLFEISANPDELFLSTATTNNVQIVSNLTESNLRL